MKFIHCADIHLDSKMESNLSPLKAKERRNEILDTFERLVAFADENHVDGIIIAGDMFDTARVRNSTKERVINLIKKKPQIDFLYLNGNHDEKNFISLLAEDKPDNLKVFGDKWTTFAYGNIKITGATLDKNNVANIYNTLSLNVTDFNIVVLHGQINACNNSSHNGEYINLTQLKNKNIDYLALGHIHAFNKGELDKRGIYCYSGCLEGRGFDECGEKGFVLLEIDDNSLTTKFIPLAKRQLVELVFDISHDDNWFDIEEKILAEAKLISQNNLLKITLKGKYTLKTEKQLNMLEQKLERFYFVKIKDESILTVTLDEIKNDVSLRGEFIRKVLASKLTDEEKEQTILVGLKALSGEDL